MTPVPHITVCICTYKRLLLLANLLDALKRQRTDGQFTFGVVVADNDAAESARLVCSQHALGAAITYCSESRQNIALARNRALRCATGDYIAFIDDDEVPEVDWLLHLFHACQVSCADGVLGPVLPRFEVEPPAWVIKGKFFDRPAYETGRRIAWHEARSGNVVFRRAILDGTDVPFRPEFATAGEDVDFFRRMSEKGCTFIWCAEAVAHEWLPKERCTRKYLLHRAMLRGSNFPKHPTNRARNILKSMVAVPSYAVALPFLGLVGQHVFLKYLIKLLDHFSRLLAFAGWPLMTQRQT